MDSYWRMLTHTFNDGLIQTGIYERQYMTHHISTHLFSCSLTRSFTHRTNSPICSPQSHHYSMQKEVLSIKQKQNSDACKWQLFYTMLNRHAILKWSCVLILPYMKWWRKLLFNYREIKILCDFFYSMYYRCESTWNKCYWKMDKKWHVGGN